MKNFIKKSNIFSFTFLILLISIAYFTSFIVTQRHFKIYETDSNTLVMGKNEHYDLILSGASHSRILSRHKNHLRLEKILNKSIFNIGQGAASCGIEEQFFYLKYFYDEGNSADTMLYFLSPPLLFSELLPIASNTFNIERFSLRFILRYLRFECGENKRQRLFEYFRSKFTWEWISLAPKKSEYMNKTLEQVDSVLIKEGIANYYKLEKDSEVRFNKSCDVLENEIKYSKEINLQIVFIVPPAVFGKWPGHDRVIDFMHGRGRELPKRSHLVLLESMGKTLSNAPGLSVQHRRHLLGKVFPNDYDILFPLFIFRQWI